MHWAAGEQSCPRLSAHSSQSAGGAGETQDRASEKRPEATQKIKQQRSRALPRHLCSKPSEGCRLGVSGVPLASSSTGREAPHRAPPPQSLSLTQDSTSAPAASTAGLLIWGQRLGDVGSFWSN